jgi:hypothetical protein
VVRDGWRHVRREVPHRGRGRGDDARRVGRSFRVVEDDVNDYLRKSFYNAG